MEREQEGLVRATGVGEDKFRGKHVTVESRVEKITMEGLRH